MRATACQVQLFPGVAAMDRAGRAGSARLDRESEAPAWDAAFPRALALDKKVAPEAVVPLVWHRAASPAPLPARNAATACVWPGRGASPTGYRPIRRKPGAGGGAVRSRWP